MAEANKKSDTWPAFARKWLPFVGVVFIFLTFLVKDVLRDHFKDLATTADSAESLFIITDALRVSPDYARELEGISEKKPLEAVREIYQVMQNEESYIKASIDTTRRLLERLSNQEKLIKALDEFEIKFLHESTEMNLEEAHALDQLVLESDEKRIKRPSADEVAVTSHLPKLVGMSVEIKRISREALDRADARREVAEYFYEHFTHYSWALFAIGLFVAVVGRHYRVEGVRVE